MKRNVQSRRNFISSLAITGATTGLTLISKPLKAEFRRQANEPDLDFASTVDADTWIKNLKGKKFPVVYDMHEHKDFWAGIWSNIYLATNAEVSNLGVAIVMRHGGFPFALNDKTWAKYKLGEFFNVIDKNTGVASVRNMYWEPASKDYPLPGLDGLKVLMQKGVSVCVCNMALKVYGGFIAQARGLAADDVYHDLVGNVLPGIQVVPAGVWALGRLQNAPLNFGYINAG
jgi:intracellular sulfur oxidation DsrE/DsrF family protein